MKHTLSCLAIGLSLLAAASVLAGELWLVELTTHFRPHLAAAAALLVLCAIFLRHRIGAILAFVALVVNAIPLWAYIDFSAYATPRPLAGLQHHRVLHFNMRHQHADLPGVTALIEREAPDFVLLTEVPADAGAMIEALSPRYPYAAGRPGGSVFDVILLSRVRPARIEVDHAAGPRHPVLIADLCPDAPKSCLRIVALHTAAPLLPGWAAIRNHQLALAAGHARSAEEGRVLLVGDLNLTPWSPYFVRLKTEGRLGDSGLGRGLVGTWQSTLPFLGLMIDHVLTGPRVIAFDRRVGPDLGSDHRPVIVDFALQ